LLEEPILQRLMYMLAITRHLDLGTGNRPIGVEAVAVQRSHVATQGGNRSPTPAPTSTDAVAGPQKVKRDSRPPLRVGGEIPATGIVDGPLEHRKAELRKQATEMLEQNYYQVLGVDQLANTSTIQAAFFQLAKKWHPDRLEAEFSDLRDLVTRAFARMSEAHALLTDPEKRKEYDRAGTQGSDGDDQEHVARVLRAASAFQRAEILFKKHAWEAAEREAKLAMDSDPDQSDHLALYAWILASKPERPESGEDPIELLNRAVELGPKNERARFWRGQVFKRAGRLEEATRDFRWVAQNNPRHVDAAREVRLYEMRRGEKVDGGEKLDERGGQTPRGPTAVGAKWGEKLGILSKLFKR
jgi:curved DNA-binding protein CbpA